MPKLAALSALPKSGLLRRSGPINAVSWEDNAGDKAEGQLKQRMKKKMDGCGQIPKAFPLPTKRIPNAPGKGVYDASH